VLEGVGYSLVWQSKFWLRQPHGWRTALSILFLALAAVLSWSSARTLGRQWRFDAGLNRDHELVTSGAYRFVRHPIYTTCWRRASAIASATINKASERIFHS
jgi:protein-S-isoprenylcysteine O-methyltransferase Ste14